MVRYRLNLFLVVLIVGMVAVGWALERDLSQPNYESIVEGQMAHSPAYDSFAPNPNFPDGLTLRQPPAGTVVRGQRPLYYAASPEDAVRAGLELRNPFPETDDGRQLRGSVVYANFCRVCHGPLGLGAGPVTQGGFPPPPSLMADRSLHMPDGQMFHILTYGQGNMPATAAQLSPEDRWSAILHVRTLQKSLGPSDKRVPLTLQDVAILFRQNCSACHGEDGKGTTIRKALPNMPDFTDLAWQVAQTEMAIVNQIDYGSLPLMPAFRYKLTRDKVVALAVYVRSFPSQLAGRTRPNTYLSPREVYQTYCFACHDTTGRGDPFWRKLAPELPDFTSTEWHKSRTDAELVRSILLGKGKFMLSMRDKLGSANVQQMASLVREFKGGKKVIPLATPRPPGPPPPEKITGPITIPMSPGKEPIVSPPLLAPSEELGARIRMGALTFQQFCITCHGEDGTGNVQRANLPPIPNFKDPAWQKTKQDAELRVSILEGKGTLMPANSDRVTVDQARDLVAYVRAFGPRAITKGPATESQFERSINQLQQQWDELEKELQKMKAQPGP